MYMNGIPPSPPIKKTPLVGVFFIGAEGEPLEVSASREKGRLETPTGRLAPSGARRFNISPSPPQRTRIERDLFGSGLFLWIAVTNIS